jgi:cytoskeletal protein RodZ
MTLGEKLRQAREERGISLSEVAEQTRISPIYLESIDNDDYRNLPGGIFNRGFVKSYAKYVGVDEQEALLDYSRLQNELESAPAEDQQRVYRPEVLTDDRSGSSNAPTIIMATIILAVMTVGILLLVNYLRKPAEPQTVQVAKPTPVTETTPDTPAESSPSTAPTMETLKVEFRALNDPVSLTASADGKISSNVVTAGSSMTFEPKQALKLSYSKSLAQGVELVINGKTITTPTTPFNPRRAVIEFEINKDNLTQIWNSGAIMPPEAQAPPAQEPEANANATTPAVTPAARPSVPPRTTPATNTAQPPKAPPANTQPRPAMTVRPGPPANRPPQ